MIPPTSRIRQKCILISENPIMDYVVCGIIVAHSFMLAFYDFNNNSNSSNNNNNKYYDIMFLLFNIIYCIEIIIKVIGKGLALHRHTLLR